MSEFKRMKTETTQKLIQFDKQLANFHQESKQYDTSYIQKITGLRKKIRHLIQQYNVNPGIVFNRICDFIKE